MTNTFEMLLTDEDIAAYTASGHWKNRLLSDYLDDAVAARPGQTCTIDVRGAHTYAELAADVDACAHALLESGVEPTDVVSIQLPNWYEWLVIYLATTRIGAVANPLIPIYRDREIGFMAATARTSVLFITESFRKFDYAAMVDRLRPDLPTLRETVIVHGGAREGFTAWDDFLARGRARRESAPADLAALRPDPNALALLMFTSGTTGRPKGVMHTHNTVLAGSLPWPDRLGLDEDSVIHMASTFGHLTGFLYGVALPIMLGGTGVFQDVWDVEEFVALVERHRVNHTSAATPFLHDLLGAKTLADHDVSSLRHFCCMGAPIPRSYVAEARQKLPGMSVFGGWGQTECCLVTMGHPSDPEEKVVSTDGRALDGMQTRVIGFDGTEAAPGEEGRLQVKGPFLFRGYLGQLDKTREEFDGEWFDTGDLATMDEDGYVRLAGRTKDVIIRGGENIPVTYVENVLYEHPDVEATAVIGIPHERLQEIAAAVVVQRPGSEELTLDGLKAFFESKGLAKPYWPERLLIVPEMPRTPSGKIQKYLLRQELAQQALTQGAQQ
ncbi:cyclohexanecarboxylate-CoA ligase [Citricoccus sp. SGAir0253]|uniref:AMP-binding protein n=1 Tax=Citricoccus sp. SGAir0253 TaxID=2567881 RepID=UPI0010CCE481|nr:AMP-binding protein [Citricoccus sp. SGAir0253]QCU78841.1 cyclohexanecarboxylate-CoA ligase [Citricoccus sp. SGAir0253]